MYVTVCNHLRGQRGERILCYSIKAALLVQHFVHIVVQCLVRFPNPLADFFQVRQGPCLSSVYLFHRLLFLPQQEQAEASGGERDFGWLVNEGFQLTCLPPCPFLT